MTPKTNIDDLPYEDLDDMQKWYLWTLCENAREFLIEGHHILTVTQKISHFAECYFYHLVKDQPISKRHQYIQWTSEKMYDLAGPFMHDHKVPESHLQPVAESIVYHWVVAFCPQWTLDEKPEAAA